MKILHIRPDGFKLSLEFSSESSCFAYIETMITALLHGANVCYDDYARHKLLEWRDKGVVEVENHIFVSLEDVF